MRRNPYNTNQEIHNGPTFNGYSTLSYRGPLIKKKKKKTYDLFDRVIGKYSKVFMLRFDLYIPEGYFTEALGDNHLIKKFTASLSAKINHSQQISRAQGNRVHDTDVDYLWCREVSSHRAAILELTFFWKIIWIFIIYRLIAVFYREFIDYWILIFRSLCYYLVKQSWAIR